MKEVALTFFEKHRPYVFMRHMTLRLVRSASLLTARQIGIKPMTLALP
jgi:hypothetical protein